MWIKMPKWRLWNYFWNTSVYLFITEIYVYMINNYLTNNWRNNWQFIIDALEKLAKSRILHFTKFVKVLSLLEGCFDLISSPSPSIKIQIVGGKITENLGFESPLRKVKKLFVLFLFIFKFSLYKNCLSLF